MCCHSNQASLTGKGRVPRMHLLRLQIDFLETESCALIIKTEPVIFIKIKKKSSGLKLIPFGRYPDAIQSLFILERWDLLAGSFGAFIHSFVNILGT